ncbi:hypothetical protein [Bibersteinia trehalosi]|uniref:hypothetical protein n=1 Tax=Bibersteinia trehalosi TaxID=47735 RepID=UPI0039847FC5
MFGKYENESFWHVVFDPPHLIQAGENSWLVKKYGKLPSSWQEVLKKELIECQPIYGHKSGRLNHLKRYIFKEI